MCQIEAALKSEDILDIRLSHHSRWLVWYNDEWHVNERKSYAKKNTVLYCGDSLDDALAALTAE